MKNFEYFDPTSVEEAVALLRQLGSAKVLAGGTDLFLRMHRRAVLPDVLVDLKRIAELASLSYSDQDGLRIGATVTHSEVAEHAAVQSTMGLWSLPPTGWLAADRHRGTVVGNLCNASPAADTAPALLSYGAMVTTAGPDGQREMPLETFFQGPGRTALGPAEIVTALRLPPPQGRRGWGFARRTRTVIDIALVSACAVIQANNGVCNEVRVSLGAVGPSPLRATQAETVLRGQQPSAALLVEASRIAAGGGPPDF